MAFFLGLDAAVTPNTSLDDAAVVAAVVVEVEVDSAIGEVLDGECNRLGLRLAPPPAPPLPLLPLVDTVLQVLSRVGPDDDELVVVGGVGPLIF